MGLSRHFEEKLQMVDHPLESDILCGKNKECLDHPGSKYFREYIEGYANQYQAADSKFMKMEITKQIYHDMQEQSKRFLKYNSTEGAWQELPSSSVRDKIGHALRFANKRKRKQRCTSDKQRPTHRRTVSDYSSSTEAASFSDSSSSVIPSSPFRLEKLPTLSSPSSNPAVSPDGHYRPVTKVLEELSKSIPQMIPQTLSIPEPLPEPKELSDGEVLSMLRGPLKEFEPRTVSPVHTV